MNKLFIVKNQNQIDILKKRGFTGFVYPLFSFCVGIENEFKLSEITEDNAYIFINRVLDSKSINNLKSILENLPQNIKGVIFEDVGVIELLKNSNIEKILYNTHFACNYESVNYLLNYVDTIILPHDITENEIDEIIKHAIKKVSVNVFGLIPSMYSRRSLITNYEKHFNIKVDRPFVIKNGNKSFLLMENDYGTYCYKLPYFNGLKLLSKDIKYALYFPIFLNDEELEKLLDGVVEKSFDDGFLNNKTIYKIKGGLKW